MTFRAQITLNPSSGLPRDEIVNRFHFDVLTSSVSARAAVSLAVEDFFNDLDTYLSALILQTGHTITYFDLDDPTPRIPAGIHTFDFDSAPSATRMPGEVAIVCSSKAAPVSGISPGSLRNRFYLGPVSSGIVATTGLLSSSIMENIADALQTMWNAINASGDAEAVVYSETLGQSFPIQQCWVNNEFDTQRRRGRLETERAERGVTGA